ncbi:DUF86 domain-containing protein [Desulfobacter postgatei]|jgi:uncharacterized protein with HEPN domain|uniref:HepT-like ribonuclease domain-containing protein n=1 Tax=Desulfobacter postgatei TaxID=2293 RepID=UPI002A36DE55|nr:DUF86 domain-containing protein [Desulfobacter postgatei]MDX9964057.1 DUF86 domain-containing protein [Desulfobacter postgatei]
MSSRSWKFRIEDIIEALDRIFHYVKDLNYDGWMKDQKTIDAVIRNLEIIGEAAANVPREIQDLYVDIPWYQMKGMRNILIHEYFGVDNDVLWNTIQKDLPVLKEKLQAVEL